MVLSREIERAEYWFEEKKIINLVKQFSLWLSSSTFSNLGFVQILRSKRFYFFVSLFSLSTIGLVKSCPRVFLHILKNCVTHYLIIVEDFWTRSRGFLPSILEGFFATLNNLCVSTFTFASFIFIFLNKLIRLFFLTSGTRA